MRGLNHCLLAVMAMTVSITEVARAEVAETRRAEVLFKVLSYNRTVKTRGKDPITLAVLSSGSGCEELLSAMRSVARDKTVGGLRVKVVDLPWSPTTSAATTAVLAGGEVVAVFVCDGLGPQIPAIAAVTRKNRIMSFCGNEEDIKIGVSVGVVNRGSRPALVVNMENVKLEGVDLDSSLMRAANAIR